jgi:hypothetical protein
MCPAMLMIASSPGARLGELRDQCGNGETDETFPSLPAFQRAEQTFFNHA